MLAGKTHLSATCSALFSLILSTALTAGVVGAQQPQIASGDGHTLVLSEEGLLQAWGDSPFGAIGDGTRLPRSYPVFTVDEEYYPLSGIQSISAGRYHSLALLADGRVFSWGRNDESQLGSSYPTFHPRPVEDAGGNPIGGVIGAAAGRYHSLALLSNGTVLAWGDDSSEQLGNGPDNGTSSAVPTPVLDAVGAAVNNVVAITAGLNDSFAALVDGSVIGWGAGDATPTQVFDGLGQPLNGVIGISAGSSTSPLATRSHVLAVLGNGTLVAWGENQAGQLGDGTTVSRSYAALVRDASGTPLANVTAAAAGGDHSLLLLSDGTLLTWGANDQGQLGNGTLDPNIIPAQVNFADGQPVTGVVGIAAGEGNSFALLGNGTVLGWGATYNANGLLADADRLVPTTVLTIARIPLLHSAPAGTGEVVGIVTSLQGGAAVPGATVRVAASGRIATADRNGQYRLAGLPAGPHTVGVSAPGFVDGSSVVDVVAGGTATLDVALGPFDFATLAPAPSLAGGSQHGLLVLGTGFTMSWGANGSSQLGRPIPTGATVDATPGVVMDVDGDPYADIAAVSSFAAWSLALTSDGSVLSWGNPDTDGLGTRSHGDVTRPALVLTAADSPIQNAVSVAAGGDHGLAALSDGTVLGWGSNIAEQVGSGSSDTTIPAAVAVVDSVGAAFTGAIQVAAGSFHSLALRADGTVFGWGRNSSGQLGDGTFDDRPTAVPVTDDSGAPLTGIAAIAAGPTSSMAIRSDGSVLIWGDTGWPAGIDETVVYTRPKLLRDINGRPLSGAVSVSIAKDTATNHLVAFQVLRHDGEVLTWGENRTLGILGDGTFTPRALLAPVRTETGFIPCEVSQVSMGMDFGIAMCRDGITPYVWGGNSILPSDAPAGEASPVAVPISNLGPVAQAGPDQTVAEFSTVTLDASASSDPNPADVLTFSWIQLDGTVVELATPTEAVTTFETPEVPAAGETLTFQVEVTDPSGASSTSVVAITISNDNRAPVADAGGDREFVEEAEVTLDGTGSFDPDFDAVITNYQWTQIAGETVFLSDSTSPELAFVTPSVLSILKEREQLQFQLEVTDDLGATDTDTITVSVVNVNKPPLVDAGPDGAAVEGATLVLDGSGSTELDADDYIVSYHWQQTGGDAVHIANRNSVITTFVAPNTSVATKKILTFELTATDTREGTATDTVSFEISGEPLDTRVGKAFEAEQKGSCFENSLSF